MMLAGAVLALLLVACHAARFDTASWNAAGNSKVKDAFKQPRRPRLRAFNTTGLQLLREGMKLPLASPGPSSLSERSKILPWLMQYLFGGGQNKTEEAAAEDLSQKLPEQWRGHLEAVKMIGQGSFGKVFKCKVLCADSDAYVTVKLVADKSEDVDREIYLMEQMSGTSEFVLSTIGSPTIPSFLDTPEGYWIMMPLMNGGELYDLFNLCANTADCLACQDDLGRRCWTALNPRYTMPYMLALFHDAVQGVAAFHKKTGFLHTDLKPENILLNCQGEDCFAAVIDLGLACDPKDPEDCGAQGTPAYIPPEVYQGSAVGLRSPKRDVWALGVILYELVHQSLPPFIGEDGLGDQVTVYNSRNDSNLGDTPLDELIIQMLHEDRKARPTVKHVQAMLKEIIQAELRKTSPVDQKVLDMLGETPSQRGASTAVPSCLSQSDAAEVLRNNPNLAEGKKPHDAASGGSDDVLEGECTDTPLPFSNIQKCGMKRQGKRKVCCVCHVKHEGKLFNRYFTMMDECK